MTENKDENMTTEILIPTETVISKIFFIRNQKVILDTDLAKLYGVETKVLNQSVRRNLRRFPDDFMFQLTKEENTSLRSQFVTLKKGQHSKYLPYVFTEHGVAMLSSVLNSERAIEINILIMRAFVKLREIISTHKKVEEKLKEIDEKLEEHDEHIVKIIEIINRLLMPPEKPIKKIGFEVKEKSMSYSSVRK
jgi:phage regulator Rha-like protein